MSKYYRKNKLRDGIQYRLATLWIRINIPKMRNFGGTYIQIRFSGTTTSRGPVDRRLISLNTLTAASSLSYARLEVILGASQAKTARQASQANKTSFIIILARRVGIGS
jgi:hypothetical protein